jgi:hypothetical protein
MKIFIFVLNFLDYAIFVAPLLIFFYFYGNPETNLITYNLFSYALALKILVFGSLFGLLFKAHDILSSQRTKLLALGKKTSMSS